MISSKYLVFIAWPNNKSRIFDLKGAIEFMQGFNNTILVILKYLNLLFQKGLSELKWTYVEKSQTRHNRGFSSGVLGYFTKA